jgi:hypothetical protein
VSVLDEVHFVGDVLEHYGVKGMKWGKVRTRAQIDADSADVAAVKDAKSKISANRTTDVLSNKELQTVVTRMNLESQYNRLVTEGKAKSVHPHVQKQLDAGKTAVFSMVQRYGEDKAMNYIASKNPAAGAVLRVLVEKKRSVAKENDNNQKKKDNDEKKDQ